jgi:hypothetical protein
MDGPAMIAIGTKIANERFGDGFVISRHGAPDGSKAFQVAKPRPGLPESRNMRADEIDAVLPLPEFEPGERVQVHGGVGTILSRTGDTYEIVVMRTRPSGLTFNHIYPAVKPHEIALSEGAAQ